MAAWVTRWRNTQCCPTCLLGFQWACLSEPCAGYGSEVSSADCATEPSEPPGRQLLCHQPISLNITLAISASLLVRGKDKHFPIHIHIHLYFCQEIFINEVLNFKAWGGEEFTFLSFFLQSTALKTENKWSYFYDMVVLISAKFQCDLIQGEACIRLWAFFGVKWPLCLHKSMLERQGTFFSLCSRSLEIVKIIKTFTVLSPWRLSHEKFMPNKSS